ncbi:MAG TPA: HEAT repeat domain-containing protein [Planctomycetota bacterium]|nr:HEAT repeat domain-containing protein [Planctomycetota bacterium]
MRLFPAPMLAIALVLGACASDGSRKSSAGAKMVKAEELPPEHRAVLEAWRAGGAAWEIERERVRGDAELTRFLVDNLVVQMVRSFDRSAIGSAVHPDSPFTRAQAELALFPETSVPVLVELLLVHDDIVAFLAADTLKRIGVATVDPVAKKLGAPEPELRRRVVELLEALPDSPSNEQALEDELARLVEHDGAWIVRAQAARSLGARAARRSGKGRAGAVLGRALSDVDVEVQKAALLALVALDEPSAVPLLIRRLERAVREGDLAALRTTQTALKRLLGETRDLDPNEWWKRWSERGNPAPPDPR